MNLHANVMRLAARPSGIGIHDLMPDFTARQVSQATFALAKQGKLHRGKRIGYRTAWFTTVALRDAFLKGPRPPARLRFKPSAEDRAIKHAHLANAGWAPDAPMVVPDHVVVQVCPSAAPRFQEQVFSFVHGGLRAA